MVFCYILIVNFQFLGLGCGPPHKGSSKEHFLEKFAILVEKVIFPKNLHLASNHCMTGVNFSHFQAGPEEGDGPASKLKAKQRKAQKA